MFRSMTGFGEAEYSFDQASICVQIQSINKKNLEINISLPKEYFSLEVFLKKIILEKISRGHISLKIQILEKENKIPNLEDLKAAKKKWQSVCLSLGYDKKEISLSFLLSHHKFIDTLKEKKTVWPFVKKAVDKALINLLKMKQEEGALLLKDIKSRKNLILKKLQLIEKNISSYLKDYQNKIKKKLKEFELDVEKVKDDLLVFLEKGDITEEIIRMHSHLKQMDDLFAAKERHGRKMEFIVQEMQRETNTICAKSQYAKISNIAIDIKCELEKIKEQVQNIE